ncbi:MAG: PorP/SprF family type IX secretion system membrane protein [Bacteroidota bacterium]
MKRIKSTFLFMCLLLSSIGLYSQDVHYSFPQVNGLVLNPALAGANFKQEASMNYRIQWSSIGDPYRTASAGYHARLSKNSRRSDNFLAAGLQFVSDKAGAPSVSTTNISFVVASHVRVGMESTLGVGVNLGFGQRSLERGVGQWSSQYNGNFYDPSIGSGETFENGSFRYFDAGIGLLYTYGRRRNTIANNSDLLINAGVSAFHLNRPNFSFVELENDRLPIRYSAFANSEIALGAVNGAVMPGFYFHKQAGFRELLLGAYYKIKLVDETRYTGFNKPLSLSAGLFGRVGDAAIAKLMVDWEQYSFGYSYDFNTSGLNRYKNGIGSHEVFLRFTAAELRPGRSSRY